MADFVDDCASFQLDATELTSYYFPAKITPEYIYGLKQHCFKQGLDVSGTAVGNGRSALNTTSDSPEQIEISIEGERVALVDLDRWMHVSGSAGVEVRPAPVFVRAGPHRVTAAFIKQTEGPVQDLVSPHEWSLASTAIAGSYGVMSLPHMRDFVIAGPFNPTGVSETPTRRRIFTCRPTTPAEERTCSEEIITRLGSAAFRRPLTSDDREALMRFYAYGVEDDGFETGVSKALEMSHIHI